MQAIMPSTMLIGSLCVCIAASLFFFWRRGSGHRIWISVVLLTALLAAIVPTILDRTGSAFVTLAICGVMGVGVLVFGCVLVLRRQHRAQVAEPHTGRRLMRYPSARLRLSHVVAQAGFAQQGAHLVRDWPGERAAAFDEPMDAMMEEVDGIAYTDGPDEQLPDGIPIGAQTRIARGPVPEREIVFAEAPVEEATAAPAAAEEAAAMPPAPVKEATTEPMVAAEVVAAQPAPIDKATAAPAAAEEAAAMPPALVEEATTEPMVAAEVVAARPALIDEATAAPAAAEEIAALVEEAITEHVATEEVASAQPVLIDEATAAPTAAEETAAPVEEAITEHAATEEVASAQPVLIDEATAAPTAAEEIAAPVEEAITEHAIAAQPAPAPNQHTQTGDEALLDRAFALAWDERWSEAADAFLAYRETATNPWARKQADFERLAALIEAGRELEAVDLTFAILSNSYDLSVDERENIQGILKILQEMEK